MAWSKVSRHARGYGSSWDRLRKKILTRDNYLCRMCMIEGRVTTANQVDHIKPKAKGGTDDDTNLQSLCEAHHIQKTIEETGKTYRAKQKIGLDGFPI